MTNNDNKSISDSAKPPPITSRWRLPFRITKLTLLASGLAAALALNIATLTVGAVFDVMSSALELVAAKTTGDLMTVRGRHKAETSALKKTNARLTRQLDNAAFVRFRGQTRTVKSAVSETTNRVSRRIARATARSTGSVAAESIPYVGIGVIVAVTAWEIQDACETMKDLHELNVAFDPNAGNDPDHAEVCGAQVPSKEEIITTVKESPGKAWDSATQWTGEKLSSSWEDAKERGKSVSNKLKQWIDEWF